MELALICAQQVIVLFLLIGAGAAAIKTGVLKAEGRQTLSNLLVYLVVPAMIIHSYMMEFSEEILHNLLAAFGLSVLAILIGTVLTLALTAKQKDRRAPIFRFACVFSNAAYMGFPLISALFGSEGLLYASAYVTVFNILLWTMGYGMVSGSSNPKEVAKSLLRTPVLYAMVAGLAIYLLQIPVPTVIAQPLELLSNMNTPLSMLITGILIATGDLKQIVCDRHIWKLAAVRMLLIPAVCLAAFAVLGLLRFGMSAQVVLLLECCPAAAITSVFAVQFGHDEQFAAGSVVLTTLLSIVFLAAAVLILYYKQISEGYEDQARFEIMQRVGMTKTDIRKSINSQLLLVFFLPLLFAGLHLGFAFPFVHKLLMLFNLTNLKLLIGTTVITFAIYAVFYTLVYRITSNSYYSIVAGAKEEAA